MNRKPDADLSSASRSPSEKPPADVRTDILIVEDNSGDVFLIREAIEAKMPRTAVHVAKDGEQAIEFFDEADRDPTAPCPALVILDINLPKRQGAEVLQHIRQSRRCCSAPVIVVSTSDSGPDREGMMKLGANRYFRKPSDYEEFMKLGDMVQELLNS